jgi:uncharacterized protein (TIGR03000 family)
MRRTMMAAGSLAVAGLVVLLATSALVGRAAGEKKVTLKLVLPADDATVKVDGTEAKGKGAKRDVDCKVPAGKDAVTVVTEWEPNNYTKITRKRKVAIGDGGEVVVDLSKADPKNPDDIVVRFVPTPDDVVEAMCQLAKIGKNDVVYDLGCGDGRMVITAVKKFGARRGVGIDIKEDLVKQCKENAKRAGIEDKVEFRQGDVLKVSDLADATVVMLYMGEDINLRLRPILQKTLKPGARIVSHRFTMGDWEPVKTERIDSAAGYPCDILLWEIKGKKE